MKHKLPAINAIRIVGQAVDRLRLADTQLTAVHADLCQLSLVAKIFNPALRLLDVDIIAIASTDVSWFILYISLIVRIFYVNVFFLGW